MPTGTVHAVTATRALPRLRSVEACRLLEHQMYFWGKDILAPQGNLLIALGCTPFRRADVPHRVSCYALDTRQGRVILHSTGVLLQPDENSAGIAYLRPAHRLYHLAPQQTPLPCPSAKSIPRGLKPVMPSEFPSALTSLLKVVRDYENRAATILPAGAREDAWREYRRTATHGIKWLPPADSRRWLDACLASTSAR